MIMQNSTPQIQRNTPVSDPYMTNSTLSFVNDIPEGDLEFYLRGHTKTIEEFVKEHGLFQAVNLSLDQLDGYDS